MKDNPIALQNGRSAEVHGWVRASDQCPLLGISVITSSPAATVSCNQSCLTCRWRILPTPCLMMTPRAADASVLSSRLGLSPKSLASLWALSPSIAPLREALSSASHDDRAMRAWSLHHHVMVRVPFNTTPPLVLRLVNSSPAQSESAITTMPGSASWEQEWIATLGRPFR